MGVSRCELCGGVAVGMASISTAARLVNFRLWNRPERRQKIEIAAVVGLSDMLGIKRTIAARIMRRGRFPGGLAAGQFRIRDMQMNAARRDVDFDLVAGLNESQRPADETLRRDMQNTSAVTGTAHARIGDAQHIPDAGLQ